MAEKEKINAKQVYDICRQLTASVEELIAKNEKVPASIIDSLKESFEFIMKYETWFLTTANNKLFGNILMQLDFEMDFNQRGAVDLKIDRTPMALTVNPLFCSQYTFAEFNGLVVDMITKMVWLHPSTFAEKNSENSPEKHELLKLASSCSSTDIVRHDIRLSSKDRTGSAVDNTTRIPNDVFIRENVEGKTSLTVKKDNSVLYYFNILERFKDQFKEEMSPSSGSGKQNSNETQENSQSSGGSNESQDGQDGSSQSSYNGKPIATMNNDVGSSTQQWEKQDAETTKEELASMIIEAYNKIEEKDRGVIPGSFLSQIEALMQPPQIDWKQILSKLVGSVAVPYRKTLRRLNRRQPERFGLPGRLPKRTVNVVCAFDTSGSMSDSDLKYCINEVYNIVKSYEGFKITIIECDAEIRKVYQIRKISEVQTKMAGRGGTSFVPVIEFINGDGKYSDSRKYPLAGRYKDAIMIYFTDGYGDSEIPKPKTYRNLWVVLQDEDYLSLKEPYGIVKSISTDKEWRSQ